MGRRRGLEEAVPEAEKGFLNVCSNLGSLSPQQGQDHICIYMASPSPYPSPSWAHSIYVCVCVCVCVHTHAFSHVRLFCDPLDCRPPSLLCPWDFPGKNTRVGCHFLPHGIFPTQGWNLSSPALAGGFCTIWEAHTVGAQ